MGDKDGESVAGVVSVPSGSKSQVIPGIEPDEALENCPF